MHYSNFIIPLKSFIHAGLHLFLHFSETSELLTSINPEVASPSFSTMKANAESERQKAVVGLSGSNIVENFSAQITKAFVPLSDPFKYFDTRSNAINPPIQLALIS